MGVVVGITGEGRVGLEHAQLADAAEQRADAHGPLERDAKMHGAGRARIRGGRSLPARAVVREAESALKRFGGGGN